MRQPITISLLLLVTHLSYGQNIAAHYKVSIEVNKDIDGSTHKLGTLTFDGFYYQDGHKTIYFAKPLFLDTYPDGVLRYQQGPNKSMEYGYSTDTVQSICYRDFDSLCARARVSMPGKNKSINVVGRFARGRIKWEFLQDQKEIHGLKCQKARFVNPNNALQWEVWFCPDIPAEAGPGGMWDLPGLVVEGKNVISGEVYTLEDYKTNVTIPKEVFWPREFMQPFRGNL